jgi:flagellar hook protein FlgE
LTLVFTPVATRAGATTSYDVTVTIPAADVLDAGSMTPGFNPSILATVAPATSGFPLDFDSSGNLIVPAAPYTITLDMSLAENPATAVAGPITFANGAADLLTTFDLLDSLDQPTITSVASPSAVTDIFQDGSPSAELVSISISDGGRINGLYSDGRTLVLAQLALARFTNPQALVAVANNNYIPTDAAGIPITGPANTAGLGAIVGLSLESSNVDIAQEFVNLLTFQRGFQANSLVITTADELNQEALNLKR